MRSDSRTGEHHQVVLAGMLDTVGEDDAATHAVSEHDQRQSRVLLTRGQHQRAVVRHELPHVPHPHPLTTGPAVAAVIQCVGPQARLAEPLRDVVIAAGVLAVAVGQHHHATQFGVRGPHVEDDADAADAAERSLRTRCGHAGRVTSGHRGADPAANSAAAVRDTAAVER